MQSKLWNRGLKFGQVEVNPLWTSSYTVHQNARNLICALVSSLSHKCGSTYSYSFGVVRTTRAFGFSLRDRQPTKHENRCSYVLVHNSFPFQRILPHARTFATKDFCVRKSHLKLCLLQNVFSSNSSSQFHCLLRSAAPDLLAHHAPLTSSQNIMNEP